MIIIIILYESKTIILDKIVNLEQIISVYNVCRLVSCSPIKYSKG